METIGYRPRVQVLSTHAQGAAGDGTRVCELGAVDCRDWGHPWPGEGRCVVTWWRRLVTGSTLDRQLDREVADHLERQVSDYVRAGLSEGEARRRAALMFGAAEAVKEECRDVRGTRWMLDAARDMRHAGRQMRRHPTSALVAALSLGLSIGAIAAIFSLIDAVLLRPLPVGAPARLVVLGERVGDHDNLSWSTSQFRSFAHSPP